MRQLVIIITWIMSISIVLPYLDNQFPSDGIVKKEVVPPQAEKTLLENTDSDYTDSDNTDSENTDSDYTDGDHHNADILHTDPTTYHNLTPQTNKNHRGKGNETVDHTKAPDKIYHAKHHVKPLVVHIGDINGTTIGGNGTITNGTIVNTTPTPVNGTDSNGTIVNTTPTPVNGTDSNGTIANTTTTPGNIHENGTDSNGTIPGVDPVKGDVVAHGWKNVIELENDTSPDIAGWARVDRICDDNLIKLDDNKVISKKFGPYNQTISYINVLGDDIDFPGISLSGGGVGQKEVTLGFQASDKSRIYLATICTTKPVR